MRIQNTDGPRVLRSITITSIYTYTRLHINAASSKRGAAFARRILGVVCDRLALAARAVLLAQNPVLVLHVATPPALASLAPGPHGEQNRRGKLSTK